MAFLKEQLPGGQVLSLELGVSKGEIYMTATAVRDITAIVVTMMIVHDGIKQLIIEASEKWQVYAQMRKLIRGILFLFRVT